MQFKKLVLVMLVSFTPVFSYATSVGIPTSGTSFAFWDTFGTLPITAAGPTTSETSLFSATWSVSSVAGFATGGGDRLYDSASATSFSLIGTATSPITTLSLQFKTTGLPSQYSVSLDSVPFSGSTELVGLGETVGPSTMSIYQWTWTGLSIPASSSFSISIVEPGLNLSVDGVRLSDTAAAAIPEPGSICLIAVGAMVGLLRIRRSRPLLA